jgi:gluconolactonase
MMPQAGQHVCFFSDDSRQRVPVADDLDKPNGIIGTPDGKTLYVADIGAGRTYRFTLRPRLRSASLGSSGNSLKPLPVTGG